MRRQLPAILLAALTALVLLAGCGAFSSSGAGVGESGEISDTSVSDIGFYLDTVITIKLYGTEDETLLEACFSRIADYEAMLSRTQEGSDVWNLNHSGVAAVEVSDETAYLIRLALRYAELSDGAFNIAIAPYTILWDIPNNSGVIPSEAEIAAAGAHVNLAAVHVDGNTVTLDDPEAAIDLGGIAKGYIADQIKNFLLESGVQSAIINMGGDVLTVGTKPDG